MFRKIVCIDEEKCNGCGVCANACHENAISMINGKAYLIKDDYCDGMGDCLPQCPVGAISIEVREAKSYDEAAVKANQLRLSLSTNIHKNNSSSCPGTQVRTIFHIPPSSANVAQPSQLTNWPVQIKLAPITAAYFDNSDILIAADCTAYSYANFHSDFIKGKIILIGCPKLDEVNYSNKLKLIFSNNCIKSISIIRMEVPCCGGLETAVRTAVRDSFKNIPVTVTTISIDGAVI